MGVSQKPPLVSAIMWQVASVPIQPLEVIQGPGTVFGRRRSASADA
jgi:hypothetical protein